MQIDPQPAWNTTVNAITESQERAVQAVQKLQTRGIEAATEVQTDLMSAKFQLKANTKMLNTLDRNKGSLLDMVV